MPSQFGTDLLCLLYSLLLYAWEILSFAYESTPTFSLPLFSFITGNETLSDSILLGNIYAVCCV